ncbi:MAG: polysaccharide lyase, partial [Acidimicrobiia bacterium]
MTLKITTLAMALLATAVFALPAAADTVLDQKFEDPTWNEAPGQPLTDAIAALREAHPYLYDVRSLDMTRTHVTRGYMGRGLEVDIPTGGFRGFGPYARLPEPVDHAWFRYYVRLVDFRPVSSGKLPGLADASTTPTAKGCKPSTTDNPGWSARLMFDTVGTGGAGLDEVPIGYYLYHLDQAADCGDELMFGVGLRQERWTCVEGEVRMNTPGVNDGAVAAWIDSRKVFARDGLAFRRSGEDGVSVRELWDNVYFGGRYSTPNPLSL